MKRALLRTSHNAGFTLIETFVAIAILMIALVGPLSLAQQSLSSATVTGDQIIAFYLAQDAMEFIRNVRDSNIKAGDDWLEGFDSGNCLDRICRIDTSRDLLLSTAILPCGGNLCRLRYHPATQRYGYDPAFPEESAFTRRIELETRGSDEIIAVVEVEWESGRFTGNFTAKQSFFNITP